MRKSFTSGLFLLMISSTWAHAETSTSQGIRESNDPQRAQEIENNARQISGQSTSESGATGAATESEKEPGKKKKYRSKSHKKMNKHSSSGASKAGDAGTGTEKIAQVTAILVTTQTTGLAITLETARVVATQAATQTIALVLNPVVAIQVVMQNRQQLLVQATAQAITTRMSNPGNNRPV
jgi:hypothetical protein